MSHIFIYGPPGSGKSSVGRALAESLSLPFIDLDAQIEHSTGITIPQIMTERGEPAFRDVETVELKRVASGPEAVIALGGGALLRGSNRSLAESVGEVVFLEADLPALVTRLTQDETPRPLLAGDLEARLSVLLEARKSHYSSFLYRVANMDNDIQTTFWEIQRKLGRYHVRGMGQGYDVIVTEGGMSQLGEMLKTRGLGSPVAVVSDENVAPHYAEKVQESLRAAGYETNVLVIPAGEAHKTLETVSALWRGFLEAGLDRKSTVIALGGGVVGDMAGFAAATYMRGCQWVAVPTTLLAMVDASMGGKTGFDLPEGKNLIGAFYPPRLVLADPDVLATLPERELRSGLAEVVKNGIISDPALFDLCAQGFDAVKADLPKIIRRAMGVKIQIIEQDPFEKGPRAALNLGHTVGHAVELVSRFELRHGEAIAIGMVAEARLAERLGLTEGGVGLPGQIETVLTGLGLPTEIPPDLAVPAIIQAMKMDKKKERHMVKFALPVKIGEVKVGVAVSDLEQVFAEA
jgi:3-dehydroquinate synthase